MSKVNRYYVDPPSGAEESAVIRDRVSPLGEMTYPTDIALEMNVKMYPTRKIALDIAQKFCNILNEDL